jgi:hypothetical protein
LIRENSGNPTHPNWMLSRRSAREKEEGWIVHRTFENHYEPFLSRGIRAIGAGNDLFDWLMRKAGRKRTLRVMDDGAGEGHFLNALSEKLGEAGIRCHTTALSLMIRPKLLEFFRQGKIDEVRPGFAETFVPTKPYDLIVSIYGSPHYTTMTHEIPDPKTGTQLQKNHLLKMAHSLKKGGLLIVGIDRLMDMRPRARAHLEAAFKKRGFLLKCTEYWNNTNLPFAMLVLQRVR